MRRELSNTRTLVAGYVQTRGQIAENPCTFCAQGKGIWKQCVVGFDAREDKPMTEACANCRFSQRSLCSLRFSPITPQSQSPRIIELEDGDYKPERTPSPKVDVKELRTPTLHDGKVIPPR
ncbi:hypothetical protein BJY01DRAFT_209031 [Aspergillus pseudoustus]|uniref:Stc1 domain-containing protein n=1 Tax=Aspergillus pseudoustus TaxID=1810923 RepID=A0ABR4KH68_9EURO